MVIDTFSIKERIEEARKNLEEGNVIIVSSAAELDEIIRSEYKNSIETLVNVISPIGQRDNK